MSEINIIRRQNTVDITDDIQGYHLPIASETQLGGIKVGNNLTIEEDGTLNAESTEYELPVATAEELGGIKIGSGLDINNGAAYVKVDTVLSSVSANPLTNATVTSAITTLTSGVQTNSSNISNLNTSLGNLSTTVGTQGNTISTLSSSVTAQGDSIAAISNDISDINDNLSSLSNSVVSLGNRMTTAEGDIDNLEIDVNSLTTLTDDEITYSYLLPVSTWTAGSITLERRGKMGVLTIDIEGDITLASGNSTIVYTFTDLNLFLPVSAVLMSDDGAILGEVDDETSNFTLNNISAHSQHITKLKGSIPLVFF